MSRLPHPGRGEIGGLLDEPGADVAVLQVVTPDALQIVEVVGQPARTDRILGVADVDGAVQVLAGDLVAVADRIERPEVDLSEDGGSDELRPEGKFSVVDRQGGFDTVEIGLDQQLPLEEGGAALVAIVGGLCLAAMRFLSAFRAESAAQDRTREVIRTFAWVLLAIFPWLLSLAGPAHRMPPFSEAALAPCLAATILLARWLYEDSGERRRFHWLLPDADQAWMMLAPALIFGVAPLMFAILPLLFLQEQKL